MKNRIALPNRVCRPQRLVYTVKVSVIDNWRGGAHWGGGGGGAHFGSLGGGAHLGGGGSLGGAHIHIFVFCPINFI